MKKRAARLRGRNNSLVPTRERLLVAALREFGQNGYAGARVDKITREAKANKQLLYHYFGNKEALFKSVLELAYRNYTVDALQVATENSDAKTALRRFVDTLFRPSSTTVAFNQILQDENRFGARHVKRLLTVKETYVAVMKVIKTILDKGVEEGIFRRGIDPREFYISLVGMFNLRTANAKTLAAAIGVPLDTAQGMARSREQAFDLILNGIGNQNRTDRPNAKRAPARA